MKGVNLFEATLILEEAKELVLNEPPLDTEPHRQRADLDVMLLEHDKPDAEPFPTKQNQKDVERRIKGDTTITEVTDLLDL